MNTSDCLLACKVYILYSNTSDRLHAQSIFYTHTVYILHHLYLSPACPLRQCHTLRQPTRQSPPPLAPTIIETNPTDPPLRNGVVELELEVRVVLLLQAPESLEPPRLVSVNRAQRLIPVRVIDVCRQRPRRHLAPVDQGPRFFGPGLGFGVQTGILGPFGEEAAASFVSYSLQNGQSLGSEGSKGEREKKRGGGVCWEMSYTRMLSSRWAKAVESASTALTAASE